MSKVCFALCPVSAMNKGWLSSVSHLVRSRRSGFLTELASSGVRTSLRLRGLASGEKFRNRNYNEFLVLSEEVQHALYCKLPVVALESTIITHGMPYPDNLSTALSVESCVRDSGSVPATVAVLQGKICVGLSRDDLMFLSEKHSNLSKISRRDLAFVLSQGGSGGTTVSATMIAAHMAGIPIFATGGVGGVHRGAETSFDVSSDLTELGQTPVTVVSSGVKSILDIPKTLEYLETCGVSVATFGNSRNFPAFFTRDSSFQSPHKVESVMEAAQLVYTNQKLGLNSGILIAVPIPEEFAASGEVIQRAINEAVETAKEKNICGREVTPYILQLVNKLTGGESLTSNIALVENNARVAGHIAKCLSSLDTEKLTQGDTGCGVSSAFPKVLPRSHITVSETSSVLDGVQTKSDEVIDSRDGGRSMSGRPVVVGATVVDLSVQVTEPFQLNGATYTGRMSHTFGGVGRNLADCLSRLGVAPLFVSVIGHDASSTSFLANCGHMNLHGVYRLKGMSTASYCPVMEHSGQLLFGIGDMDINSHFDINQVKDFDKVLETAPLLIMDGNFSPAMIEAVTLKSAAMSVPVWFEPTDLHKATKPFLTEAWRHLTFVSPNRQELTAMWTALRTRLRLDSSTEDTRGPINLPEIIRSSVSMCRDLIPYIPCVLLTLGQDGVLLCHDFGESVHAWNPDKTRPQQRCGFKATYYPELHADVDVSDIVSVSGAGDCLASAFISAMLQGKDMDTCVWQGMQAAWHSMQSWAAVPLTMSSEVITVTNSNDGVVTGHSLSSFWAVDVTDGQLS